MAVGIYSGVIVNVHVLAKYFPQPMAMLISIDNYQHISIICSHFFMVFVGFFGTLKLIRLCRFNQRIYLFIQTLQLCAKELVSFAMMFSIVFMSFMCLFYFLFQTAEILFEMILMKFDVHELTDAAAFLGPFCFSLFIFMIVFFV